MSTGCQLPFYLKGVIRRHDSNKYVALGVEECPFKSSNYVNSVAMNIEVGKKERIKNKRNEWNLGFYDQSKRAMWLIVSPENQDTRC